MQLQPPDGRAVRLPSTERPRLFVVVDTEEEFDWNAPYSRANVGVTAMRHVDRGQRIFDRFGVKPTYVIDFPVASQPGGYEPLREIAADGRCTIGAHLHPWVNPPYVEEVTTRNSFTMNLPEQLQRDKLAELSATIEEHLKIAPTVFKAGRYGLGARTVSLLEEAGYTVDMSVCPQFDFAEEGGPSFTQFDSSPFFLTGKLLEVPCTVDYTGWSGPLRPVLHRLGTSSTGMMLRAPGILSRLNAAERIMLSPEGNNLNEMCALTRALIARGYRTFTLSFHSPSLDVGHTPYVQTTSALDGFLETIDSYCTFFFGELHGIGATPLEFRAELLSSPQHQP